MRVGTRSVFMCDHPGRKTPSCPEAGAVMGIFRPTTGQAVVTTTRWSARLIRRPRHCSSNRCNSENQRRPVGSKPTSSTTLFRIEIWASPRDHDVQHIRVATDPSHFGQTFDPRARSRPAARPVKLRHGAAGRRFAEHGVNQSARPPTETIATDPALAGAAPFVRQRHAWQSRP